MNMFMLETLLCNMCVLTVEATAHLFIHSPQWMDNKY